MARTAAAAIDHLLELLRDPTTGYQAQLQSIATRDAVSLRGIGQRSTFVMNAPGDLVDQNCDAEYPQLFVYAEQVQNVQREKFSYFSGPVRMAVEVRISADDPQRMEASLHRYSEALLNVLHVSAGEWLPGIVYTGRYSATFAPIRQGGDNFVQSAKFVFELDQFVNS